MIKSPGGMLLYRSAEKKMTTCIDRFLLYSKTAWSIKAKMGYTCVPVVVVEQGKQKGNRKANQ
jgi:hypothetical protein